MRLRVFLSSAVVSLAAVFFLSAQTGSKVTLRGEIIDAGTGEPVPARLYIQSSGGDWFFARTADEQGTAVPYEKRRGESVEAHTALSAQPFVAELPPGEYSVTIERGKEYLPLKKTLKLEGEDVSETFRLERWINMAGLGWYSGETHVHRPLDELPAAMLAEDLNVALPLTYWVTQGGVPPGRGDKNRPRVEPELIKVDPAHVIYPMNTEWEIFTIDGKRHTLGAVFALNHKRELALGAPPVGPIAKEVHNQGGLLELDKHGWPWSMMLVPVMGVDLYELANNHMWRTKFHFREFGEPPPAYMNIEQDERGMTERGWIGYTFQNYYALLNSGFRLRPTAGTASGVHPVPPGFGRVYARIDGEFSYDSWIEALDLGRTFVTTGPMLSVQINGTWPGAVHKKLAGPLTYYLNGWARSARPLKKIEVISNGEVIRSVSPENRKEQTGAYASRINETFQADGPAWFAVRCFSETEEGRVRFAHTAPFFVDVDGRRILPRPEEIEFLIGRVEKEIERNKGVLSKEAMAEYEQALERYREIAAAVREAGREAPDNEAGETGPAAGEEAGDTTADQDAE